MPKGGIAPTSQSAKSCANSNSRARRAVGRLQHLAHPIEIDLRRRGQHQHDRLVVDRGDEHLGDVLALFVQHRRHFLHGVHLAMFLHFEIRVMLGQILFKRSQQVSMGFTSSEYAVRFGANKKPTVPGLLRAQTVG